MSNASEILTLEDVCKRYQLKPGFVYTLKREGRIPYVKVGKLLRFPADLLAKWESQRTFLPKSMK